MCIISRQPVPTIGHTHILWSALPHCCACKTAAVKECTWYEGRSEACQRMAQCEKGGEHRLELALGKKQWKKRNMSSMRGSEAGPE